jgi:hypothetical protein
VYQDSEVGAEMNKAEQIVHAIEAFIDAKIAYARRLVDDPEWATMVDVNETREHLTDLLLRMVPK